MAGEIPKYPEDCIQSLAGDWWQNSDDKSEVGRGRLIWTYVPFIDLVPNRLVPDGRVDSDDHSRAKYRMETWRIGASKKLNRNLPVAALPEEKGTCWLVHKAKVRPAIVVATPAPEIDRKKVGAQGAPKYQTTATLLVAPYYGADKDGTRSGLPEEFIRRIRHCEYPQYFYDKLPLRGSSESILRLDSIFAIGRHHNSYEWTKWKLTDTAISVLDEMMAWMNSGELAEEGLVNFARTELPII